MKKPKILFYDIETAPNLAYVWGKWQQDVISFVQERELLSFAYAINDGPVKCITREKDKTDKKLVSLLASLLNGADVTIAHNGDSFDRKVIKARMLYWNMKPLKLNSSVDTKKVAKTYFNFNGNGLNDLCKYLKIGSKAHNAGFDMWLGCISNDPAAWKKMAHYNRVDVVILRKLYNRMLPWIENHPNLYGISELTGQRVRACPTCASNRIKSRGLQYLTSSSKRRWQCKSCGKQFATSLRTELK